MSLTSTHFFCGGGGDTAGLAAAGFTPVLAANHDPISIATHAANFPDCEHLTANLTEVEHRRLPRTDVLWASPICTEIAPAGRQSRAAQGGRFGKTRATALTVIAAAETHRYDVVLGENVSEFATDWELFDWWVKGFALLGYDFQLINVSAAHIGGPGNLAAPQWRDRIFFVFSRRGIRMPKLEPRPDADCVECGPVQAEQAWKPNRRVGKYGLQYTYRCARGHWVEPHVRGAEAVFDGNPGGLASDRGRPYAPGTEARIAEGLKVHGGRPFFVTLRRNVRPRTLSEPMTTVTAGGNHHMWVTPHGPRVTDCQARIINPREQARAQRFPDSYVIHGTRSQQTSQAGNAVPVNVAQWIGQHVYAALGGEYPAGHTRRPSDVLVPMGGD